jgi:hypothetical protein
MELVKDLAPGQFTHGLVLVANFRNGANLSRGGCVRVSPDEWAHGVIFKIASSDAERKGWILSLLFCPFLFNRLDNEDAIYAEANSLHHDIMGAARVATRSARQLVYNMHGFKTQQEKGGKPTARKTLPSSGLSTCACQPARST